MSAETFVSQCSGKIGYASRAVAEKAVKFIRRRWNQRRRPRQGGAMIVYHCEHCGLFHIGRPAGVKKRQYAAAGPFEEDDGE